NWSYIAANNAWCSGSGNWTHPYIIENVTIDGQGSDSCISIKNSDVYFKIKNCTLFNSGETKAGISLDSVRNGTLIWNNCSYNNYYGIFLDNCNNITIEGNTIHNNGQSGILQLYSNWSRILNNNLSDNLGTGCIELRDSYFNVITKNNGTKESNYIILLHTCNYNNVSGNIANNSSWGIALSYSRFNNISNNILNNTDDGLALFYECYNNTITENNIFRTRSAGITIEEENYNNTITRNLLSNNGDGIYISGDGSDRNFILENNISKCRYGISLKGKSHFISQNNMEECGIYLVGTLEEMTSHYIDTNNNVGGNSVYYYANSTNLSQTNFSNPGQIILVNSNDSIISNLDINQSSHGVSLFYCHNDTISHNNISNAIDSGIYLNMCNNLTISENSINNTSAGPTLFSRGVYGEGISLDDTDNSSIVKNNLSYNDIGIELKSSFNNSIKDNLMNRCGLVLSGTKNEISSHTIETSNLVNDNSLYYYVNEINLGSNNFTDAGQVILVNCNNSIISDMNVSHSSYGISIFYGENFTLSNINASYNFLSGIGLTSCWNVSISWFSAINNSYGVSLVNSYNCSLIFSNFSGCLYGVSLSSSHDNNISNNKFVNHQNGIISYFGSGFYISNNTILNNLDSGILILASSSYNITGNIVNDSIYGIKLFMGAGVGTISENYILNNKEVGLQISDNSLDIYYNVFSQNGINAEDYGNNNNWDDGFAGNYWDDYTGGDLNQDGIGDFNYSIPGNANNNDTKPLMYPIDIDTDGDGFINYEEYTLGIDNYRTSAANPDSDYDELSDYWEWLSSTNPWNNDTDSDNMPDGWEVFNSLDPLYGDDNVTDSDVDGIINFYEYHNGTDPHNPDTDFDNMPDLWEILNGLNATGGTDNLTDADNDLLLNLYEFLNGTDPHNPDSDSDNIPDGWEVFNGLDPNNGSDYLLDTDNDLLMNIYEYLNGTDPQNADCDGDSFLDGIEISLNTKPLNRWWYPMPNLEILEFKAKAAKENEPFTLNFTIINNGIWTAEEVFIRIKLELGNLTLWDNFNNPINLEVNETYQDLIQIEGVTTSGGLVMLLELDPFDSINETYSSQDGSLREDAEDNTVKTELQIERVPGDGLFLLEL
ncbi:MAG: NosD domain-containing protein, partial [Promethearchaeota archaeon]